MPNQYYWFDDFDWFDDFGRCALNIHPSCHKTLDEMYNEATQVFEITSANAIHTDRNGKEIPCLIVFTKVNDKIESRIKLNVKFVGANKVFIETNEKFIEMHVISTSS